MKKIFVACLFFFLSFCFYGRTKDSSEKKSKKNKNEVSKTLRQYSKAEKSIQTEADLPDVPYIPPVPNEVLLFELAYSDLTFESVFDPEKNDWKIGISSPAHSKKYFYWCEGRLLPEEELPNKDNYVSLLYKYPKVLEDPANFSKEKIQKIVEAGSRESRKNGPGSSMFFFDFVYYAQSRRTIEKHISKVEFLGMRTNVHERIVEPLKNIESRILEFSKVDPKIKEFIDSLKSADAFNWRLIDGTNRKSFHSYGISFDILPKRYGGKSVFWSWEKDRNPKGWMVTPLSRRWRPPDEIVEIFESEGFIWGGKWVIWDNMHFEYHPEILLYSGF